MSRARVVAAIVGSGVLLLSCATPTRIPESLRRHVIAIDEHGAAALGYEETLVPPQRLDEMRDSECVTGFPDEPEFGVELERNIQEVVAGLRAHHAERCTAGEPTRVRLFLHGGLVTMDQALAEAERTRRALPADAFYPVFVNWETGPVVSYLDYLFRVRAGERASTLRGVATAPLYLFADALRAIGRSPRFLSVQTEGLIDEMLQPTRAVEVDGPWCSSVHLGEGGRPDGVGYGLVTEIVPGALRILTTPTFDFLGDGAYSNMLRRGRVLFLLDSDLHPDEAPDDDGIQIFRQSAPVKQTRRRECGAMSRLMNEIRLLEQQIREAKARFPDEPERWCALAAAGPLRNDAEPSRNRNDDSLTRLRAVELRYRSLGRGAPRNDLAKERADRIGELAADRSVIRVDIVAHSMGANVANEILHRHRDLYFENVAYLAAASTIDDFASQALPYLRANPTTEFFVVTLHPELEPVEENYLNLVPQGSLLDWLDRYISSPRSKLDRTLGTWNNIVQVLPVVDYLEADVRGRLHVVGFGTAPGRPRMHGEFNDPPGGMSASGYTGGAYWSKDFWLGAVGDEERLPNQCVSAGPD